MRATTSDANNGICPACGDRLTGDPSGKGFVRHTTVTDCPHDRGERDERVGPGVAADAEPGAAADRGRM